MTICYECNKEINSLEVLVLEHSLFGYTYDDVLGYEDWDRWDCDAIKWENLAWRCPECHRALPINNQAGANKFLSQGRNHVKVNSR